MIDSIGTSWMLMSVTAGSAQEILAYGHNSSSAHFQANLSWRRFEQFPGPRQSAAARSPKLSLRKTTILWPANWSLMAARGPSKMIRPWSMIITRRQRAWMSAI